MENSSIDYYVLLIGGTAAFLLMAGGILFFVLTYNRRIFEKETVHQKDLFDRNLEATELERTRVARELHDEVGSALSMMRLMAVDDDAVSNRKQLKQLIDDTIDNVRRISNDLLPSGLEEFGLEHALEILCDKVHEVSGIEINSNFAAVPRMKHQTNLIIYRIIQELVNNTLKYAEASHIDVSLRFKNSIIELNYKDSGKGFNYEEALRKGSLGIKNIMARAESIGGKAVFFSKSDGGMCVTIKIPFSP